MAMANMKTPYLPAVIGLDEQGHPMAFHLEGFLGRDPYYKKGENKKSYFSCSIGIGQGCETLMARAQGDALPTDPGQSFVEVKVFGPTADSLNGTLSKGDRIAVCGRMSWREFDRRDGTKGRSLEVAASTLQIMRSKAHPEAAALTDKFSVVKKLYTDRSGEAHIMNMASLVGGEVIGFQGLQTSGAGIQFVRFGIKTALPSEQVYDRVNGLEPMDGSKQYDAKKKILNVIVYRKAAVALAKVLQDGAWVVCTGPVSRHEYSEKVSFQLAADQVSILRFPPKETAAPAPAPATPAPAPAAPAPDAYPVLDEVPYEDEVLDGDELPF